MKQHWHLAFRGWGGYNNRFPWYFAPFDPGERVFLLGCRNSTKKRTISNEKTAKKIGPFLFPVMNRRKKPTPIFVFASSGIVGRRGNPPPPKLETFEPPKPVITPPGPFKRHFFSRLRRKGSKNCFGLRPKIPNPSGRVPGNPRLCPPHPPKGFLEILEPPNHPIAPKSFFIGSLCRGTPRDIRKIQLCLEHLFIELFRKMADPKKVCCIVAPAGVPAEWVVFKKISLFYFSYFSRFCLHFTLGVNNYDVINVNNVKNLFNMLKTRP